VKSCTEIYDFFDIITFSDFHLVSVLTLDFLFPKMWKINIKMWYFSGIETEICSLFFAS
jgi:hypothetical protein